MLVCISFHKNNHHKRCSISPLITITQNKITKYAMSFLFLDAELKLKCNIYMHFKNDLNSFLVSGDFCRSSLQTDILVGLIWIKTVSQT